MKLCHLHGARLYSTIFQFFLEYISAQLVTAREKVIPSSSFLQREAKRWSVRRQFALARLCAPVRKKQSPLCNQFAYSQNTSIKCVVLLGECGLSLHPVPALIPQIFSLTNQSVAQKKRSGAKSLSFS